MDICRAGPDWDWQSCPVYCNVYFCAQDLPEPVISCFVPPFLAAIDDESIDIFCRLIFPCLCADLIARPKIFFHMPNSCHFLSLRLAVESSPYVFGISLHLHPETGTQMIPFKTIRSLLLGRPVAAGFGSNGSIMSHCLSVISVNFMYSLETNGSWIQMIIKYCPNG